MKNYRIIKNDKDEIICIERIDDNGQIWSIPTDPANSDYQQYLRWLDNPNADEFTNRTGVVTNGDN